MSDPFLKSEGPRLIAFRARSCLHFTGGETEAEEWDDTCLENARISSLSLGPELRSVARKG